MSDFHQLLGDDLWSLVGDLDSCLVDVAALTSLPARRLNHAAYRLEFADGRQLKGRRLETKREADRMTQILAGFEGHRFPRIIARSGASVLEEWIDGTPMSELNWTPSQLRSCGALLGKCHRLPLPPGMSPAQGCTPEAHLSLLDRRLAALVAENLVHSGLAEAALRTVRALVPAQCESGVVHGDFCAHNLVLSTSGEPVSIDNETMMLGAYDYDLGRSWYRWPMEASQRELFLEGYQQFRSARDFLRHHSFWMVTVLTVSAEFRHRVGTNDLDSPLGQLNSLLSSLPSGKIPGGQAPDGGRVP